MKTKSLMATIMLIPVALLVSCSTGSDFGNGGGIAAPVGLSSIHATSTSITLTWTAVSGAARYKVYRAATSTSANYQYVDETEFSSYIVSGLIPATTYYFKVSAIDMGGIEGPQSTYASGTTSQAGSLAAPAGLTAAEASSTSISLNWSVVSGAAKYNIYTSVTSTGVYSFVDETVYNHYTASGLVPDHVYYYKVSAIDINGTEGSQSAFAQARTPLPLIPVPSGVNANSISHNSIQVSWNAVSGASGYRVYRSASASGVYSLINGIAVTTLSYTDTGLNPSTAYYYKVSALTATGEGEQSGTASATTPAEPLVPAPGGIAANPLSVSSIQISWNAVTGAMGYRIFRSADFSGPFSAVNTAETPSYTDTGLSPATMYHYRVSTMHLNGESGQSGTASATTHAEIAISPPIGLGASAQQGSIQVSWNNVSNATSYRIYRSNSSGGTYSFIGSASASPYTDSGLSPSTTYYYKVSSLKDSQESEQSSGTASATTPGGGGTIQNPPVQPAGLVVSSVSSGSIGLSWNASTGADTYNVYRSVTQTGTVAKIATVNGTTYTNNIPPNDFYFYSVTGENSSGESPKSNVAFAYATNHFDLSPYSNAQLYSLASGAKHYYRLAVTQNSSYTIQWQNGSNQNVSAYFFNVTAYQNNGTQIFIRDNYNNRGGGYTDPPVFTATATGFVTIEVNNATGNSQNYQIYCYGSDGSADSGTVALPPYQVNAFRVSSPSQNSITLTWDAVSDGAKYNIYRANTQAGTPGKIGESNTTSFIDNQVPPGGSFWYTIAAVNTDGREGCRLQGAFGFAALHYNLSEYSGTQLYSLDTGNKHYYRLAVIANQQYTIQWQNGNNQNVSAYFFNVTAYQNNGTQIFIRDNYNNRGGGYTDPPVFTATATGFVTIEVNNSTGSSQNYQIYYY